MKPEEGYKLVKFWQEFFRLQNWNLSFEIRAEKKDRNLGAYEAYTLIKAKQFRAAVIINNKHLDGAEKNILHEMVHILFRDLFASLHAILVDDQETLFEFYEEQFTVKLSNIIYSMQKAVERLEKENAELKEALGRRKKPPNSGHKTR